LDYLKIANSSLLYLLAAMVIVFVMIQSVVFLKMAFKRGESIGLSRVKMMEAVKTSAVFAVVPSIPIVIALIAIAPVLGMPFSWMRLSVIGSQAYELIAAGIGASAMGIENLGDPGYTGQVFVNSMWVMTIGIIWGLLLCIFALKRYQSRIKKVQKEDSKWAELMINALFFGMLSVFLGRPIATGGLGLYVMISSGLIMLLLNYMAKKTEKTWINDFALSVSMIAGMGLAILFTNIGLG